MCHNTLGTFHRTKHNDFNFRETLLFKMTASTASPKKKEDKTKEDKINEIMADGATTVKMEVDYR